MRNKPETINILVAENDPADRLLIHKSLAEREENFNIHFVTNEAELLAYLYHRDQYAKPASSPTPHLILLDLNLPHRGQKAALEEIKAHPQLKLIPVIGLTPTQSDKELFCNYQPGGSSYISKPTCFEEMVDLLEIIDRYWFELVKLPDRRLIDSFE
ncbi:response regulator receiver [Thalassoporum mexicanum PCC 7367]|uniref:response regulator n=1 Tax=Thalassoporum mexicanum TaxID=3457544 RepID=UPI00029FE7AF|nr:response regulator [Pseudanabaena sp. PCC 7367]AFY68564.1 response regulator receiver [Pseudanabaena sp. PCC 7367]